MIRKALLDWYRASRRDLPWRRTSNPYRILVSELMLQQTQVVTVIPYYKRFLKIFPSAKKLAAAQESQVLKAWEGLGYYRRARFLHASAKLIAQQGFPRDLESLLALPGVGVYTAAAVASIALGLPAAVVDGNVIRVLSRLFAMQGNPSQEPLKSKISDRAQFLLDVSAPGDFNQALMELGALICSPTAPDCAKCPFIKICTARKMGRELDFPQLAARPVNKKVLKVAAVIVRGRGVLMAKRTGSGRAGDKGRMNGLWQFPERVLKLEQGEAKVALALARRIAGPHVILKKELNPLVHQVTNHRITVKAFIFEGAEKNQKGDWTWLSFKALESLPLAKAERQLLKEL